MAVTSGFFNSINHDRLYDAAQMSSMFDGIINDGILISYKDKMMVSPLAGMNVKVGEGKAWFRHTWTLNDSGMTIQIEAADPLKYRKDLIYLEVNNGERNNKISIKRGDYYENEEDVVKPSLEDTATLKQYPLAYIKVDAGTTEIDATMIENMVGTEDCPFANGLIEQVTVSKLYEQWGIQFVKWWEDLRVVMSDDVAGKLQNEIDDLRRWVKNVTIPEGSNSYTIESPYIKADSLIDIYYNVDSVEEATRRNPKYTQEEGKVIINFSEVLSKDVIIDGLHINCSMYPL